MKKDKLEKMLLRYSGAAAAVLGVQSTSGQIIWTDVEPDLTLDQNGEFYDFNIDADTGGVVDYRITQLVDSLHDVAGTQVNVSGTIITTESTAGNQVLGLDYGNYNYPFRLNVGDPIGQGQPFKGLNRADKIGYLGISINDTTYPHAEFTGGVTDKFIGIRFKGDLNDTIRTYYGWIHVDVAADLKSMTIKGFGYESQPGEGISAGYGSPIGIEETQRDLPEIAQRGLYLDVNLPETLAAKAVVRFTDLSGRSIDEIRISDRKESISLAQLPKGVHVATIRSNGMEVSRKVVVY